MSGYDIYVFCLCFITLAGFAGVLGFLVTALIKSHIKATNAGAHDEELKAEYNAQKKGYSGCLDSIVTLIFCAIFIIVFVFSIVVNISGDMFFDDMPTLKMVNSGSMSKKHEKNTYLKENNLNNQIQTFDLIFVYKAPSENEIELYDVVLYEVDGKYVVHRVVGIEEANQAHPNGRFFLCRGDANESADRFPVLYSQIKGIYRGQRVPFIGSFITFLQSPAGWMCLIVIIFAAIIMPMIDKKLQRLHIGRLTQIKFIDKDGNILPPEPAPAPFAPIIATRKKSMSVAKKLVYANGQNQDWFTEIDNLFRSYSEISVRISHKAISYCKGRKSLAKITFNGRTIRLFLALDANAFDYNKYFQKDMSEVKTYASVPFAVKIKSERAVTRATELIWALRKQFNLTRNSNFVQVNSIKILRKDMKAA